jgi:CDP-4-dehydro-6-deoxyglucose reductase/ferredoxin-NAD(P)+ reductase (naphthalene dioxygenase ferredoxin-specific)
MTLTIWTGGRALEIAARDGETILEAALAAGIRFPFGCRSGECGVCKCELVAGPSLEMRAQASLALSPREMARGRILACCAVLRGPTAIRLAHQDVVDQHALSCRVVAIDHPTEDVAVLRVQPELGRSLPFKAGQFARICLADGAERAYSMANRPDEQVLEFHVRRWPDGAVSGPIHDVLAAGDRLVVKGPFGDAWLRADHPGPILAIAAGTGLAPVKSIVRTALALDGRRRIDVYFGVRRWQQFYDLEDFRWLAKTHPNVRFVPVAEQGDGRAWRTGRVIDRVAEDVVAFAGGKLYIAGPPAMVQAGMALADRLGIGAPDRHFDAFAPATDAVSSPVADGVVVAARSAAGGRP